MKKLLVGLTLLSSVSTFANTSVYSNDKGCKVEKDQKANGVVLYVNLGNRNEVIGYANDYSFGDFVYCAGDNTEIDYFNGVQGTGILIACSEHQNGHRVTRGRVDLSLDLEGNPVEIKIDGQVKKLFGWAQDVEIECSNLVKK